MRGNDVDLTALPIHELAARYQSGAATPTQAVEAYLRRIEALDPKIRAYVSVGSEQALAAAEAAARRWKAGHPLGPLDGIP
ncbi:MAG: amidase family protein, partial [Candidatus Methylomirabilia bacterium]